MANRSNEPLLWALFSGGGVVAAFLIPILLFLYGLAFPLGWLQPPDYERTLNLVRHPVGRLGLFVLCFLSLFHWAHRFRFTLYDGPANQAPQSGHHPNLLRRSRGGDGGGRLPVVDPPLTLQV